MGFESSQVARRRLAALAATNGRIQEALAPSQFPGLSAGAKGSTLGHRADRPESTSAATPSTALVQHLDLLAHDIMNTPGAGGALIAAYAAQARALSMVVEAARRAAFTAVLIMGCMVVPLKLGRIRISVTATTVRMNDAA